MNHAEIQMLLAECGWYSGAIDGDVGRLTWGGAAQAERAFIDRYTQAPNTMPRDRRLIAAGQVALSVLDFEPGAIDGLAGHNTSEALTEWRSAKMGLTAAVPRKPMPGRNHAAQAPYPKQADMESFYGPAGGPACTAGRVDLPYPMIIAWDRSRTIRRFSCHEALAEPLTAIFRDALDHYGLRRIEALELDVFGGCFNHRRMRGGRALSTHAYGAAVDLNPEKNRLRWGADRAQFAHPDYQAFWDIVMTHGGVPAGYAWGKDWMHFQFARL